MRIVEKIKEGNKIKGYRLDNGKIMSKDAVVVAIKQNRIENAKVQKYKGLDIVRVKDLKEIQDKSMGSSKENEKSCNDKKEGIKLRKTHYVSKMGGNVLVIRTIDNSSERAFALKNGKIIDKDEELDMLIKENRVIGIEEDGSMKLPIMTKGNIKYRLVGNSYTMTFISNKGQILQVWWANAKEFIEKYKSLIDKYLEEDMIDEDIAKIVSNLTDYGYYAGGKGWDSWKNKPYPGAMRESFSFKALIGNKLILHGIEQHKSDCSRMHDGMREYDYMIDLGHIKEHNYYKHKKLTYTGTYHGKELYVRENKIYYGDTIWIEMKGEGMGYATTIEDSRYTIQNTTLGKKYLVLNSSVHGKTDDGEYRDTKSIFVEISTGKVVSAKYINEHKIKRLKDEIEIVDLLKKVK